MAPKGINKIHHQDRTKQHGSGKLWTLNHNATMGWTFIESSMKYWLLNWDPHNSLWNTVIPISNANTNVGSNQKNGLHWSKVGPGLPPHCKGIALLSLAPIPPVAGANPAIVLGCKSSPSQFVILLFLQRDKLFVQSFNHHAALSWLEFLACFQSSSSSSRPWWFHAHCCILESIRCSIQSDEYLAFFYHKALPAKTARSSFIRMLSGCSGCSFGLAVRMNQDVHVRCLQDAIDVTQSASRAFLDFVKPNESCFGQT